MKVLLFGNNTKNITELVTRMGLDIVTKDPEVIITYGGDGTLLSAERQYPGVPKLPIRNSRVCKKCSNHEDEVVVKNLLEGKLLLKEHQKLETVILYKDFYALNDFVIRNVEPTHTIRFKTSVSGDKLLIGDGIVVATAFGSTGYFKSITGRSLENSKQRWGLAFNNTTEKVSPVYPSSNEKIGFQLTRGRATLTFDNSTEVFTVDEGSEVIFKLSDRVAKIYEDTSLRCPNCRINRD